MTTPPLREHLPQCPQCNSAMVLELLATTMVGWFRCLECDHQFADGGLSAQNDSIPPDDPA